MASKTKTKFTLLHFSALIQYRFLHRLCVTGSIAHFIVIDHNAHSTQLVCEQAFDQTCYRLLAMPSSAKTMITKYHTHWTQEQDVVVRGNVYGTRCLLKLTLKGHVLHLLVCYHLLLVQH